MTLTKRDSRSEPVVGDNKADHHLRMSQENDSADQILENLGYKPELARTRSTFQVAFMSFVLASIPYGLATTLVYPLLGGGPVDIIWGWVAVSAIIVCVAASLGEITSVYPTAGGMSFYLFFSFFLCISFCLAVHWLCIYKAIVRRGA